MISGADRRLLRGSYGVLLRLDGVLHPGAGRAEHIRGHRLRLSGVHFNPQRAYYITLRLQSQPPVLKLLTLYEEM